MRGKVIEIKEDKFDDNVFLNMLYDLSALTSFIVMSTALGIEVVPIEDKNIPVLKHDEMYELMLKENE